MDIAIFAAPGADGHAAQLSVARAAARQVGTDAVDVFSNPREVLQQIDTFVSSLPTTP